MPRVEFAAIAPEIALSAAALVILLVDAFVGDRVKDKWYLAVLSTIGLGIAIYTTRYAWELREAPELQLSGMAAADGFAVFAKVALAAFGLLTVWLSRDYLSRNDLEESEFYALVLFATAGMMLMATAADLILMFLALETFSIALYVLVGFRRRSLASQESAMKYFLLGAFSSTFFLFGIALVYGAVGSTNLYTGVIEFVNANPTSEGGLLVLGVGFLIVGLGFKIAAVPFHMWTPDAYQGAPSPVTGFMAAGSKLAGFAALLRLLDASFYSLRWDWQPIVIGIAVLTMIVGSVLAVTQDDLKRMLAYSSIAHAGFVLTGLIAANDDGVSGALFYLATYGLTVLGAFAIVALMGGRDERLVRITDYRGLFDRHPLIAGSLTLFLLSLAGVPLTAGFVGKLVVFGAVIEAGYAWVAVVGVLASAIAAFFYLRVMVSMYMQEGDETVAKASLGPLAYGVIAVAALGTVVFGLAWSPLISLAEKATFFAGG
jgi:NADH-quinone oxidoreductase subunit N